MKPERLQEWLALTDLERRDILYTNRGREWLFGLIEDLPSIPPTPEEQAARDRAHAEWLEDFYKKCDERNRRLRDAVAREIPEDERAKLAKQLKILLGKKDDTK